MRFLGTDNQSLALTVDGGTSATKPVTINGDFNSFTRLPSGTILVGGVVEYSTRPGLFRSHDRGTTFEMVANPPAIRALSQRGGKVYGAADNFGDGYALGTSTDEGTTWQALMTYADVKAINPCLKAYCQTTCEAEVMVSLWTEDVCTADAPRRARRGSSGTGGGRAAAVARGRWRGRHRRSDAARETRRLRCRRRAADVRRASAAMAGARVAWPRPDADAPAAGLRPHPDQIEVAAADRLGLGGRCGQGVERVERGS